MTYIIMQMVGAMVQIVYNDKFVYARYPEGEGKIIVCRITETEDETEKLEIVDESEV